jgi:hypothetical protein
MRNPQGRVDRQVITAILVMLATLPGRVAEAQTIHIANVEQLYNAVNNPGNAGVTLVLAPGTYRLSVSDSNGQSRPNGGRIELQPDMSLKGTAGDRNAVVISAFDLPPSSFPQAGVVLGPNAALRLGLGRNALEWLTVRDARFAQANVDTGLQPLDPGTAYVRIAHIASSGSTRGLNVLNAGPATSGQTIEADIVDSDFFDNDFNLSEGVRLGNFLEAVGSTVNARMSGNRSWGQKQGRLIVNNRAQRSTVNVLSTGNRFYGNGAGTIIIGGLSSSNIRADGNAIHFESHGDHFVANDGETEFDHGGLIVLGTENISTAAGGGSYNTVNVALWGDRMLGNHTADIVAIGARSLSAQTAPHSESNLVMIEIRGNGSGSGKWLPVEYFADSLPPGPSYGNLVTVIRH